MGCGVLVLIEEPGHIDRLIPLIREKQRGDTTPTIIALGKDACQELAYRGVAFKMPQDYGLSEEEIADEGLRWFRSWPNIKVRDGKNIKELMAYDGISIWWLIDDSLYLSPFVFHRVRDIIKQVVIFDRITEVKDPSVIYYVRNDTPVSRAIEFICKSKHIATVSICRSSSIRQLLSKKLKAIAYIYGQWLRMFLRKMYWMFLAQSARSAMPQVKGRILLFSGSNWVDVHDLATGELRKGDPYYDSVIELMRDKNDMVLVDIPTGDWALRTMKEKKQQKQMICRPFECYLNTTVILKAMKASIKLHRDYQLLVGTNNFRQSLNFHDMPLYDLVKENLSLFFSRGYLARAVAIAEMAKRMIEAENPDAILMSESPVPERAIIAAAKSKGIPTIAATHGGAMTHDPYFHHAPEDIGPYREAAAPYCPISDKIIVYGEHDKDIVVNRARFPEEDVVIGGQPRYDILAKSNKLFDRERILYNLNLDPAQKLITWMTQSHSYTLEDNKRNVIAVYNAMRSLKDVQLVVKLHPGEDQKAALYREDRNFEPTIVGGFGAITFELLYVSDMVITHYCTTAMEALMLDKPVIVIDFSGTPISVPYVESGAAVGVCEESALLSAIEDILHNEETNQRLAKAREKFITEGNYKADGQASQRVVDLIEQVVADSRRSR